MPLDAQGKIALEKIDELFAKAAKHSPDLTFRTRMKLAAHTLAQAVLEICPSGIYREEAVSDLEHLAIAITLAVESADEPV